MSIRWSPILEALRRAVLFALAGLLAHMPVIPHNRLLKGLFPHNQDFYRAAHFWLAHTPVLITAAPDHALSIARVIATRGRGDCTPEVLICDPTAGDDVLAAMADHKLTSPEGHAPILLLKEVQGLTTSDQAAVLECLDRQQKERSGRAPRVIASTSIDLFGCVERGTFDAQLFYRLNTIHIAVPSR